MNDTTPLTFLEAPRKKTFAEWLDTARPGEQFVYYGGILADRFKPPSPAEKAEADAALNAYGMGEVELTQRLIKVGNKRAGYEYIATKRKNIEPPLVHGAPWKTGIRVPETAR